MRVPCVVLCSAGLLVAGAMAGSASAAQSPGLTQVVRPQVDQVVGNGKVRVVVRTRASLGRLRVAIDGHSVKRYLRRTARGYRGTIRLRRGLHYGVNELIVATRGDADFDRVKFIVARRNSNLVRMSGLRVHGREAPARVVVTPARRSTLQAWVNGHRVEHAFQPDGRTFVGRLGANDWVRPGRNRLVVLTHRTALRGRNAAYDVERETFRHERGRVIAGAGRDRVFSAGGFVTLRGSAAAAGRGIAGAAPVEHRWRIVAAPPGPRATLHRAANSRPELLATAPGYYRVRTRVTAPNGSFSTDTATVAVRADVPPLGWQLDTTDDRGKIVLDGKPVAGTEWPCAAGSDAGCPSYVSWAVFNRQTLEVIDADKRVGDAAGMKFLADRLDANYRTKPFYLVVVNLSGSSAALPDGVRLLKSLGVDTAIARPAIQRPISVVGVPGSPPGSAFVADPRIQCAVSTANCPAAQPQHLANMTGYLRLNPAGASGGWFEFVFGDQPAFDTDAAPAPGKVTMTVGDATYEQSTPTDGSSGFVLLMLDSTTLEPNRPPQLFRTNNPDRSEIPAEELRMAKLLEFASVAYNGHGELLMMLQAYGTPRGRDGAWLLAAAAIERLGGNAQIFAQLNQGNAEEPFQGRYAFVGRSATDAAGAEASQSLTGLAGDGRLRGILTRGRDARYQPLMADAAGTVNAELVSIVNRPQAPHDGFPVFAGGEAAAAEYLGRDPKVIGVCPQAASEPCDVRRAYYENSALDWATILSRLGSTATLKKCATPPAGAGFDETQCNAAREQFEEEIAYRNIVETYFGPKGLQGPFAVYGVATSALVNVPKIAEDIKRGLPSSLAGNATANVFSILTYATKIAGASSVACSPCGAVAGGLGGAFGLAAYLTQENGTPDVIGPEVDKAATSLAGELFDRYQKASRYFATEAQIVMSDYTKMTDIANKVQLAATSEPRWNLDPVRASAQIEAGTRQAIYKALVPVAYPVLYDLGPMARPPSARAYKNAREWRCAGNTGYVARTLFQNTGDDAQLRWRTTDVNSAYFGEYDVIAVGATRTVGNTTAAYIPGPPNALTDTLFRDTEPLEAGGVGLDKLEFYSPRYFKLFPKVFRMDDASGWTFCGRMPNPPGGGTP